MSDQDQASKTEEPTPRRLQEARGKGQVAQSKDVGHLIMLAAALVLIMVLAPPMMRDLTNLLRRFLALPHEMSMENGNLHTMMVEMTGHIAAVLLLPFVLFTLAAVATGLLQHGFLFTTSNLAPRLDKINPLRGLARMFSLRQTTELGKGIIKMLVVAGVAVSILAPPLHNVDSYVGGDMVNLLAALYRLTVRLLFGVIGVLIMLAAIDYFYQKWELMKSLRMTKTEIMDEFKQLEGDPKLKSRLRSIRQQRSRQRMMAAVPTATVVVTNPTHFAVALKYEQSMNAPIVVAKGVDWLAHKIIDVARENFVPVVENPPLARTLYAAVELDDEIPREHYKAVAEVIGYVMRLKRRAVH